ncbi:hypothetical protein [Halopiger xanaduensis]|uniref:Membrane-bound metal-dependent hydrolase n=1 Tax=Halopiger xanaduensis (strain DSM 18323 / JCM 14033 / SH-6) TaxID=797210 RepID=F8DCP3_HALXS|nr:hypothetical protein [Halopiger xanaduensis]AEH37217.1 hypothetical protein Halxa_2599 [Halopiger xanaduensis SH-6]
MSLVVAGALAYVLPPIEVAGVSVPAALIVAYAVALGVFIDLDHFLIARFKTGSWDAVRFCLSNPTAAVADQDRIFGRGDVGVLSRLLSHLLLAGILVSLLALASVPLAILTGAVLYVHIVCDVIWDIWRLDHHADAAANEDELLRALR